MCSAHHDGESRDAAVLFEEPERPQVIRMRRVSRRESVNLPPPGACIELLNGGRDSVVLLVFADPKTDVAFTRSFGDEARKPLPIALLNGLLELRDDLSPTKTVPASRPATTQRPLTAGAKTSSGRWWADSLRSHGRAFPQYRS